MANEQEEVQEVDDLIALLEKPAKKSRSKKIEDPEFLRAPMYRGHDIGLVRTVEEWDAMMEKCLAAAVCGFDIETLGKDPFKHRIHGFSLAWDKGCGRYVFWDFVEQYRAKVAKDLQKLRLVSHGGKFDFLFLAYYFPEFEPLLESDTLLQLHLDDPDKKKALKWTIWRLFKVRMMMLHECLGVKEEDLEKDRVEIDFSRVPLDRLCQYGVGDADLTLQLFYYEVPRIRPQFQVAEGIDTLLQVPVLTDMELWGMKVDKGYLQAIEPMFERCMVRMQKRIYDVVGHPFDLNSPKQVGKVLYQEMGLKPLKFTKKTGAGSTAAEDLEKLAKSSNNDVLNWIVECKHHGHSLSNYVRGMLNGVAEKDGCLHCEYLAAVAPTYRLACVGGELGGGGVNVQQIPKIPEILEVELADEEKAKLEAAGVEVKPTDTEGVYKVVYNARKPFVARPGYYIVSADYQAIEFRILVNMAGEEDIGRAIRAGEDAHLVVASLMYRKNKEDISKSERDGVKSLNYGLAYGMQPWGLKERLECSEEEAIHLYNLYFQTFPKMRQFIKGVQRDARRNGYILTQWGRRRYVEQEYMVSASRGDRSAINTTIQGSGADVMRYALVKTHFHMRQKYGRKVQLIATLHDQILFEVANDIKLEDFIKDVKEGMELDRPDWLCPLVVDISYGPGWGDLKDWGKKAKDEKKKAKQLVIESQTPVPADLMDELNLIIANLPNGDMDLVLRFGGQEARPCKVNADKKGVERISEALGEDFQVGIEDAR